MDDVSKTLVNVLQEATLVCHRALEMTGMDEHFHAVADTVYNYPVNTLLLTVHFTTLIFKIRISEGVHFACSNPFGSLLSSVILCFAGSIIQNLLLGIAPIQPFEKTYLIPMACLVWYLIFFCPLDLLTKLVAFLPFRVFLIILKEVYRIKCIISGIQLAVSRFPEAWCIIIAVGSIRGCGSMVFKPFAHHIVGLGPAHIEFHRPSFTTKLSILISCVFSLQVKRIIDVSLASTSLIFTVVFITFQLLFLFTSQEDPFMPFENALASIFFRHSEQIATTGANERKKKSD